MRIRAQLAGDKATVRVLMSHEMETGQRKGLGGQDDPRLVHPGRHRGAQRQDRLTAQWGPSIAKNPFLQFTVKGREGRRQDQHRVDRQQGDKRSDEAAVA